MGIYVYDCDQGQGAVLVVAHRDHFSLAVNNGVERDIKERERANDAFEAKIWLARMK